jgi:predicted ester cyclase
LGVDESLEEAFEGLKERMTMFPDQSLQVQDLIVKGDKFVFRGIFSGTHTGDSEGFPATGKKVEIRGFAIMRVENGRIVEDWGITDLMDFHEQLGFEMKRKKD